MLSMNNVFKRINACFILTLFIFLSLIVYPFKSNFISTASMQNLSFSSYNSTIVGSPFKKLINWLFPWTVKDETNAVAPTNDIYVYAGGNALGFTLECEGVVIVGTSEVLTKNGAVNPTNNSNIMVGDVLYSIEGKTIYSAEMIEEIVNSNHYAGKSLKVVVKRKGMEISTTINPALDLATNKFKLGLWIRDNAAGVGTLSYVRCDNGRFGALGHPVCDIDTGAMLPINKGEIYACNIIGITKGERGKPGELRGLFLRGGDQIGDLDNNTNFGVFGQFNQEQINNFEGKKMLVGHSNEVKVGKATILCTLDGTTPKEYSIEIIKTNQNNLKDQKNMVIRITDQELLDKTGGIVQGMSGSPIIQNNKLIGAITHVFVSDPTKGFATFIDNMINS